MTQSYTTSVMVDLRQDVIRVSSFKSHLNGKIP